VHLAHLASSTWPVDYDSSFFAQNDTGEIRQELPGSMYIGVVLSSALEDMHLDVHTTSFQKLLLGNHAVLFGFVAIGVLRVAKAPSSFSQERRVTQH